MSTIIDRVNNLIFLQRERGLFVLDLLSGATSFIAFSMLIYRYGWILTLEEKREMFEQFDLALVTFMGIYLGRLLFSIRRVSFIAKSWFEATLMACIGVHALTDYFFEVRLLPELIGLLGFSDELLATHLVANTLLLTIIGIGFTKVSTRITELDFKPATTFIASFVLLIIIGTFLLMLPAMTTADPATDRLASDSMGFLDALFTATSASCVTGLAVEDTGSYFTIKGKLVLMMLFQLGGIGIVSFATFFATFLTKGVGLKHQSIIQDFLDSESLFSAKGLLQRIIIITISIEAVGAALIFFSWDSDLEFNDVWQKIFYSVFHSVSAFCNAGFSLFNGGLASDLNYALDPNFEHNSDSLQIHTMYWVHFFIALLIVFGSAGFSTIEDIFTLTRMRERWENPWKGLKISTSISLYASAILIVLGTVGFLILEGYKLTDRNVVEALVTCFFQSVTTRTAGFNTLDFGAFRDATIILCIFLMFVGAAPGSTGGGIKVTTFLLIAMSSIASIRGQKRIEIFRRTIPNDLVSKAFSVFMFATTYNLLAIFLLTITESGNEGIEGDAVLKLVFEQISAFSTVGLSMGITASLSAAGKVIIIASMFIGRVGTLTLALALSSKVVTNSYRYPEGHVMVG